MDGQGKKLTKLYLQIYICQLLIIRLSTLGQVFIPCSEHGILNKIITVLNLFFAIITVLKLKSEQINMIEKCVL